MTARSVSRLAAALFAGATASATPAYAADWLIYTSAQAGANPDSGVSDVRCSGTRASPEFCGANAQITPDQPILTSSVSATNTSDYAGAPSFQHGDGYASADLATGTLHIADHAVSQGLYRGEATYGGALAEFQDTLTFATAGTDPFALIVRLHIDGLFEGYQQPRFGFDMQSSAGDLYGLAGWSDGSDGVPSCVGSPIPDCVQQAFFLSFGEAGDWIQFGPSDFIGRILIDPSNPVASIGMSLSAGDGTDDGVYDTFAEFGHTASVQFDLPQGVTFTSASGAFLTSQSPTGGVPEPTTWVMVISGFGFVAGAMRRRIDIRGIGNIAKRPRYCRRHDAASKSA